VRFRAPLHPQTAVPGLISFGDDAGNSLIPHAVDFDLEVDQLDADAKAITPGHEIVQPCAIETIRPILLARPTKGGWMWPQVLEVGRPSSCRLYREKLDNGARQGEVSSYPNAWPSDPAVKQSTMTCRSGIIPTWWINCRAAVQAANEMRRDADVAKADHEILGQAVIHAFALDHVLLAPLPAVASSLKY
jgi:hypothetical protein